MLELGDGWSSAILDNQREYDFVKVAQKGVINNRSYWIGGSTNQGAWSIFPLSSYNANEEGNNCVHKMDSLTKQTALKTCWRNF